MMTFITAPLIVGICVFGIYKLFELFARRRERLAIIDKFSGELSPDNKELFLPNFSKPGFQFGALKIGCLLVGLGLGLLIGFMICQDNLPNYVENMSTYNYREIGSAIYGSCVLTFGGIGLLVAFVIEVIMNRKKD